MRNVFIFFAFLIAGMAHAQIITNVDKLRIRDIEQGLESDKILVIDSDNVVRWIDAIEVDLSDYYTISEVDTFVADLEAGLLERYTKDEVDALLDGLELRLDDYYTKTEVDSIITNVNDRIDNIDLNTVTSVDNVTSIKIRGSSIFTNNLDTDFAQIADVNKAGFGLISMQSEMKIGLVAKDGTTLLDDVDLSWLASGDLAVTIDDTDPINPELVFSQNGVEVARIPASTLLSGVARSANLSNYILQFKDGSGAVVYSVNLGPLFEDYFTKAEANARFALRTRTISAGNGLTGGGNLTANRTIALSTDTQEDIAKGVEAHGWGDFRDFGLGNIGISESEADNINGNLFFRTGSANVFGNLGSGISLNRQSSDGGRIAQLHIATPPSGSEVSIKSRVRTRDGWSNVVELWHSGNLTKLSQLENDLPSQLQTINLDSSHPYRATLSGNNSSVDLTHLRVNPITNPDAKPTFNLNYLQGWRDVFQSPSVGIRAIRSSTNSISFGIDFGFNHRDRKFKVRYLDNAGWHPTENVATESWVNDQGFIKDLSDYYTKNESNDRFALRTRTISAGNGLTGGGNLTANRTIGLSTTTQEDIAKGVEAHGWGDFRDFGLGTTAIQEIDSNESKFIRQTNSTNKFGGIGVGINVSYGLSSISGQFRTAQLFINRINSESFTAHIGSSFDGVERVRELWHTGNFTPSDYVQKVTGKGLSSNDFTNTLKSKLDGIATGATKNRPDSQNAGKTENNIFSGNNTFTNPVKVPMGVNPDEAINLAQLTASNPIALNKIVPSVNITLPNRYNGGPSTTLKNDGNYFIEIANDMIPTTGSALKIKTTLYFDYTTSQNDYYPIVFSSNLGIAPILNDRIRTSSPYNYIASLEVDITLIKTSSTQVKVYTTASEVFKRTNTNELPAWIYSYVGEETIPRSVNNTFPLSILVSNQELPVTLKTMPIVIERIK